MTAPSLFLDPSSSCTGYAVLDGSRLVEGGRLRGKSISDSLARVLAMRKELLALLEEFSPAEVVVELPTGKQWTRNQAKKSGFAVWSGAAWALWMVATDWAEQREVADKLLAGFAWNGAGRVVAAVSNTAWTRGHSKGERQAMISALYRNYEAAKDPGGDVSDAIALGLWWREQTTGVTTEKPR